MGEKQKRGVGWGGRHSRVVIHFQMRNEVRVAANVSIDTPHVKQRKKGICVHNRSMMGVGDESIHFRSVRTNEFRDVLRGCSQVCYMVSINNDR